MWPLWRLYLQKKYLHHFRCCENIVRFQLHQLQTFIDGCLHRKIHTQNLSQLEMVSDVEFKKRRKHNIHFCLRS